MIYQVRHVTTYRYGSPVTFAQCALTLTPRSDDGQTVRSVSIGITPQPRVLTEHQSFFGHAVTTAEIHDSHRELRIEAQSIVDVHRRVGCERSEPWEAIRASASAWPSLQPSASAPVHFLFPSSRIALASRVTEYARASFTDERPIVQAGQDLMHRIHADFEYAPDATRVSTPLIEAFDQRHGVCQDYAHIMIAGLRGLGVPARYVSGYIRTVPPEGQPRLEGADATHAWIDVWCGAEIGWLGLDPTNAIQAGNDHVVLATGRDYADIAPVGGILIGSNDQSVHVGVDVLPLSGVP